MTANPKHRLRRPEITAQVLRLLVNKVPMRRICEVADIRPAVLYQRISLLHERWAEPPGDVRNSADAYAKATGAPFVRRQIAGLYTLRVLDFLEGAGALCLILPVPLFLGPTSGPFVPTLVRRTRPRRLINFGDLQGLIFPTAENACHVYSATRRLPGTPVTIDETFDYWVPKADLSLALGRLTLLSADRHVVQTQAILDDPQWLITLMWGDEPDAALLARLSLQGVLGDFYASSRNRSRGRWLNRKGVHVEDKSRQPQSADPLRAIAFAPIEHLREGLVALKAADLTAFPDEIDTVVGLNPDLMAVFDGPRIIFPDGFSRGEAEVRTNYLQVPAAFTSSVGVLAGSVEDAPLLQFLTLYLRSSMAKYFLLMRVWKLLCDRNALHLTDLDDLPFHAPEDAADPKAARATLQRACGIVEELGDLDWASRAARFDLLRPTIDELVFDYFGLTDIERALVHESVEVLLPSVRPRSHRSLDTAAQQRARPKHLLEYATAPAAELDNWREALGGTGRFEVSVRAMDGIGCGPVGAVRVAIAPDGRGPASASVQVDDAAVAATLRMLREQAVLPQETDLFQLNPDTLIWTEQAVYLVRPLVRRVWLVRTALQDARRVVQQVHRPDRTALEVAA